MDPALRRLFCDHVAEQSLLLVRAADRLLLAFHAMQTPPPPRLPDREPTNEEIRAFWEADKRYWDARPELASDFWGSIQTLVGCAANISKLLWGTSHKSASERADLRAMLSVSESSPLDVTGRLVRNHLEHFDERLVEWHDAASSRNVTFIDRVIGLSPTDVVPTPARTDIFRTYDPSSGKLVFWGDALSIPEVVEEVSRILPLARAEADKSPWEP